MKQFKFRLEKVLRYKRQIENRKKQTLSERNAELNIQKNSLLELHEQKSLYQKKFSSLFKGKINVYGLVFSARFLDRLSKNILHQNDQVKKSEDKLKKAKLELREAMRDRKKYERIKEKRKLDHEYEMRRAEQKEFDEFGTRKSPVKLIMDNCPK